MTFEPQFQAANLQTVKVLIEIVSATVILTRGTDRIMIETKLPSAIWPFEGNAIMQLEVAQNKGEDYVKNNFGFNPEVISSR